MAHALRRTGYSLQEYLELEEASNTKHEYFDGEIYAMAGGTAAHAAIASAITASLVQQVRGGPCRVYSADLRIRVNNTGLVTYPDISVVCGDVETAADSASTILNPRLLVEVLSDSTENYDRHEKWSHYQKIPSLAAYLLASQHQRQLELWTRAADEPWRKQLAERGAVLTIEPLALMLDVDAIYEDAGL